MDNTKAWELIHRERAVMADTLAALTPAQWAEPSLCAGWSVHVMAGHILVPVGGKKRIGGLRLVASDLDWSHGAGPEVSGSGLSLLLAMTGRSAGLAGLTGGGVTTLGGRM